MNHLVVALVASLLPYVRKLGDEYLEKGLGLIMDALTGTVSDEDLIAFLRERAEGKVPS